MVQKEMLVVSHSLQFTSTRQQVISVLEIFDKRTPVPLKRNSDLDWVQLGMILT